MNPVRDQKLIYLANIRLPTEKAHGIQIMKMCEAFGDQGIKVELIIPWRFNKIKEDAFDFYGVKKNFKIKKIFSLDLIPLRIPKIGFWIQSLSFAKSVFFYLLFRKANVVYSRDSFPLYLVGFFKKDFIYEIHTFPKNFSLHRGVFKKASAIVAITYKLKESLVKKGIDKNKILVAPDGVDIEKFDIDILKEKAREKLNLPLDKKIVLYTGHLYKWKGAQILADAAKLLDKKILIVFIGGTDEDRIKFESKNKGINNILILGQKPYSNMPYYLKSADILVLPNSSKKDISKKWTSPMKMFEYMASKRPIIASDLPSIREILNEDNAVLFESDNCEDLANKIMKLLKDNVLSDKISVQAFEDVMQHSWMNRVNKIISLN
jgi:glycosyltransferase involved in cell wall biosynthesis